MDSKGTLWSLLTIEEPSKYWFNRIAEELLLRSQLVIAGKKYEICEIEFYLYNEKHPDPYVHKTEAQLTTGEWYFHREKSAKKGFTFKGIDLTFGNSASKDALRYGGILIRTICPVGGSLIEGPSKTVDCILDENKVENVLALKTLTDYKDNALNNPLLRIITCSSLDRTLAFGPRVGLKKKEGAEEYQQMLYRYTSRRKELKKEKMGLQDITIIKPRLIIYEK